LVISISLFVAFNAFKCFISFMATSISFKLNLVFIIQSVSRVFDVHENQNLLHQTIERLDPPYSIYVLIADSNSSIDSL